MAGGGAGTRPRSSPPGTPAPPLCRPRPVRQVSWGFFLLILKEALPRPTQLHMGVPFPPPSGPAGKGPHPGEVMPAPCGVVSGCIPERAAPGPGALLPRAQTSLAWLAGHKPHRAQQERKKAPVLAPATRSHPAPGLWPWHRQWAGHGQVEPCGRPPAPRAQTRDTCSSSRTHA